MKIKIVVRDLRGVAGLIPVSARKDDLEKGKGRGSIRNRRGSAPLMKLLGATPDETSRYGNVRSTDIPIKKHRWQRAPQADVAAQRNPFREPNTTADRLFPVSQWEVRLDLSTITEAWPLLPISAREELLKQILPEHLEQVGQALNVDISSLKPPKEEEALDMFITEYLARQALDPIDAGVRREDLSVGFRAQLREASADDRLKLLRAIADNLLVEEMMPEEMRWSSCLS